MKVEFIKDHVNNKAGDVETVSKERGQYLLNVSVVKKHVEHKEEKQPEKKTKEDKQAQKLTTKKHK